MYAWLRVWMHLCAAQVTGVSESMFAPTSLCMYICVHTEVTGGAASDQVNIDPVTLCAQAQSYI